MLGTVASEWTADAPPVRIHAEAGPALTPAMLAAGPPGSDAGAVADAAAWVAEQGLTQPQLEQGAVVLARIGWTGAHPGPRRAVHVPVLRGAQVVLEGSVLEVEVAPSGPLRLASVQSVPAGEAPCVDHELAGDEPGVERLNGRRLGSPRMRTVFTCPALHSGLWQRAAIFWHHEALSGWAVTRPGSGAPTQLADDTAAEAAARVAVYQNLPKWDKRYKLPVLVDGRAVGHLRQHSTCVVLQLRPGVHRVATGTGTGFWDIPRREVVLQLAAGQQAHVEYAIDEAVNNNLLLGITHYRTYMERGFRLVQRPMLTSITGCADATTVSVPAAGGSR